MKSRDGKSQREEKSRREKIREDKESEERSSDARKGRKVARHRVFPVFCGSGGSKSRLAKAAGAEPAGQMRDEKVHAVVARSTFTRHTMLGPLLEVEMSKKCTPLRREAHFGSQNVKNTTCSDHFWTFRCRFAWQAQGIVDRVKSEQNVRVL